MVQKFSGQEIAYSSEVVAEASNDLAASGKLVQEMV